MTWSKPDFVEISLGMEVTAYVYTDEPVLNKQEIVVREEQPEAAVLTADR
jgi:coenzyme PQQ precursor peptide PqqA